MGRIARVIENIKNRINMNMGGSYNSECENVQQSGDDSRPLPSDDGYTDQWGESGRFVALGFFDYDNKIASPGEKRIYSRDSSGVVKSQIHLKNSGEIEASNDSGSVVIASSGNIDITNAGGSVTITNGAGTFLMSADGSVNINGFIIGIDGSALSPVSLAAPSVLAAGKELSLHIHPAGSPPGNTGVNS